ncbi:hypothetical protein CSC70_12180 [Pseudoxanthomonas kalamensis DSM 18571]|uniref:metal-dependent hydrolase n=1 Tax=Pseudoxanthomonas kalamensis TaxID=289483 RepID=UPI0013907A5E|nr:metal-dependent hydrolase [Pseudoxanthomonas kalamensis]KAF1708853.1 hypothetical protein CSC70_12180 [Pseudoxanthomonas kalamensis DSM 18571]
MPSILTHAVVPLAMSLAAGRRDGKPVIPRRLLLAGIAAAMLPDADVLAFALKIPYADAFGHRGASHSLLFALILAALGAVCARPLRSTPLQAGLWLGLCTLSHPLLDAMTSGGLGVALYWPWSNERLFAPWRPILVSPFANGFFSARGLATLLSELRWVWLPMLTGAMLWRLMTRSPRTHDPR